MSRLDTSDPAISAALAKVSGGSSDEYVVLGYVPKTAKIKVVGEGSGWDDMCEEMNEGKVMYSYNRRVIGGKTKFVFVAWTGEGVDGVVKGQCATHVADMNAFLKKCGAAVHLQVNARNEADVVLQTVEKQLAAAGGANYDAGAKKQGAESVHRDMRTLNQIHTQAQIEANKDRASGDIKTNTTVIDKSESDAYWTQTRAEQQAANEARSASKPQLDTTQRNQFWAEQRRKEEEEKARQAAERQAATQSRQVNKGESDQYWQQQRSAPAPAAPAPRGPAPTGAAGGASSLRSKFEAPAGGAPAPPAKKAPAPPPSFGGPSGPRPGPPPSNPPPVSKPAPVPPAVVPPSAPPPAFKPAPPVPPPAPVAPPAEEYQEEAYQEESYQEETYAEEYQEESYAEESYAEESYGEETAQPYAEESYAEESAQPYAEESYAEESYAEESYAEEATSGYVGQVQASYDFPGENEGDLAFSAGDIINVLEKDDSGWWRGELNGAQGVFPSTFVQEM